MIIFYETHCFNYNFANSSFSVKNKNHFKGNSTYFQTKTIFQAEWVYVAVPSDPFAVYRYRLENSKVK